MKSIFGSIEWDLVKKRRLRQTGPSRADDAKVSAQLNLRV